MLRHLIAILSRIGRIRRGSVGSAATAAEPLAPGEHPTTAAPAATALPDAEPGTLSRQPLSWPARDLSRSRQHARAAPDDETVPLGPPPPQDPEIDDDDATIVLPKPSGPR